MIVIDDESGALPDRLWDVVVIGAGPAGSSSALRLARAGHEVLLVESKSFPREKVCGGCLNQIAVAHLRELGVVDAISDEDWRPLDRFELSHRGKRVLLPLPGGAAVERAVLDQVLVDKAVDAGVEFAPRTRATVLDASESHRCVKLVSRSGDQVVRAKLVISACGLGNQASNSLEGHQSIVAEGSRIGLDATLQTDSDRWGKGVIHMHVSRQGYVGVARLDNDTVHLAAAVDRLELRRLERPESLIRHIVATSSGDDGFEGEFVSWSGTQPLTCRAKMAADTRLLVIGDAAGYVEPFTGEGIRWALGSAEAVMPFAERAVKEWTSVLSEDWIRWNRKRLRREQRLCRTIAWTLRQKQLTAITMSMLQIAPWMARPIVRSLNKEP